MKRENDSLNKRVLATQKEKMWLQLIFNRALRSTAIGNVPPSAINQVPLGFLNRKGRTGARGARGGRLLGGLTLLGLHGGFRLLRLVWLVWGRGSGVIHR